MGEGGALLKNRYDEVGAHPRVPVSPLWASCVHSCLSYWSVSTPSTFPPPQHLTLFSVFSVLCRPLSNQGAGSMGLLELL